MDFFDITKIVLTLVGSITISGAMVTWFVKLGAKTLSEKYIEKVKHGYEKELASYKSELGILRATTLKYNDKQFDLYLELWKSLQELKFSCEDLWFNPEKQNLKKFEVSLQKTHRQIEVTSLLLEDTHYKDLLEIISDLQKFNDGKQELLNSNKDALPPEEVKVLIDYNTVAKEKCLEHIQTLKISVKELIHGKPTTS
jgi:hypothetical protein